MFIKLERILGRRSQQRFFVACFSGADARFHRLHLVTGDTFDVRGERYTVGRWRWRRLELHRTTTHPLTIRLRRGKEREL